MKRFLNKNNYTNLSAPILVVLSLVYIACGGNNAPEHNACIVRPDETLVEAPENMVPYDELPEEEKVYDRNTSIETLKFIVGNGYEIKKRK